MTPMRKMLCRAAVAALVVVSAGAGTGTVAQPREGREGREGRESRENWVVRAVKKNKKGIIAIKVLKNGEWGPKEIIGTGVVIDERGYAVTNHHVITSAERIVVRLADGTSVRGTVYADDPAHDLAILRLSGKSGLQALTFAPASDLMVGEDVVAIGHPYGYNYSVSKGIISAIDREIEMPSGHTLTGLIQTDASINPGNSGGPLFNVNGELIGINVALREGAHGIAFTLNADTVKAVLRKHLNARKVAGVRLGLNCREVVVQGEDEDRQRVVVEDVTERGPAARAGLKQGDVIVEVGGRLVSNRFDLERALLDAKVGDRVETAVVRQGKQTRLTLTLAGVRVTSATRASGR